MRYAIYFIPPADHPLTLAAGRWLGRDPYTGAAVPPSSGGFLELPDPQLTAEPRRYGFHATLKAPFRLANGATVEELRSRLEEFAQHTPPVELKHLRIARLGQFFALTPETRHLGLDDLAARLTIEFDCLRAPLSDAEIARRHPETLSESQRRNLLNFGYPHVFDDFRFHMTLTGPVDAAAQAEMSERLERFFGPLVSRPLAVNQLALFVEPEDKAPFLVDSTYPLAAAA